MPTYLRVIWGSDDDRMSLEMNLEKTRSEVERDIRSAVIGKKNLSFSTCDGEVFVPFDEIDTIEINADQFYSAARLN